ncbi:hypothetical protein ADL21_38550 [Streptomyces albus subsp. albus]|nr:hypothetical protein ADL21_38550 [Streptomyces albus subsp. albus]
MSTLDNLLHHRAVERLRLSRERIQLICIEKRRDRYERLIPELAKWCGPLDLLPVRVEVPHGEAGRDSERILTEVGACGSPTSDW